MEVDPLDHRIAYICYSGFNDFPKVWRTNDKGASWEPFDDGLPSNVPVKVIRVKPDEPHILYLGTDQGMYRRNLRGVFEAFCIHFGTGWLPYGPALGMPNVPVYDISFDLVNQVVYAATHGRGAFMLSYHPMVYQHIVFNSRGYAGSYVFGHAFTKAKMSAIEISLLDSLGQTLSRHESDARGGKLMVDEKGRLIALNEKYYGKTEMISIDEGVVKDTLVRSGPGETSKNARQIRVSCDGYQITIPFRRERSLDRNPPSSLLSIRRLTDKSVARLYVKPTAFPSLDSGGGETRFEVIEIGAYDSDYEALRSGVDKFNRRKDGYHAKIREAKEEEHEVEDIGSKREFLMFNNPDVRAKQIFTEVRANPGEAMGVQIGIESIGLPLKSEIAQVRIEILTSKGGAKGGSVTLVQRSPVGLSRVTVQTKKGAKASEIAERIVAKLFDPTKYGHRRETTTFDQRVDKNSIVTSSAIGLIIEVDDPGIGVWIRPE